ncbi:HYC_CC_PP family protein [Tenacibaculum sp. 190524A05c]|uniref:HYC_CC_PP family protein n=1 Tax=Tenacibaculum platacis TaxID=3137852 RepID=UPI0031FB5C41
MKSVLTKISSFVLALLVLFSTFSFTVAKHYCGDFLVGVSYFGDAKNCADELGEDDCDSPQVIKKKNCCKDEVENIEGQDDLRNSIEKFDLEKQKFVVAYVSSLLYLFSEEDQKEKEFLQYSPPKLTYDLNILHEVFII